MRQPGQPAAGELLPAARLRPSRTRRAPPCRRGRGTLGAPSERRPPPLPDLAQLLVTFSKGSCLYPCIVSPPAHAVGPPLALAPLHLCPCRHPQTRALCARFPRGRRELPRRWPSRAGVPERRDLGRAIPRFPHPARRGAARDPARGPGTPARPLPPAAAAKAASPACSDRPGRTATRGAHGPRPPPARAHLGGAGPVAPIAPPRRLRISRAPARRPPGRPSVPAGAKEGGGDARRPRGPGAAGAASCRPQPSRKFVRPGPAAASAPARAPAPAPAPRRGAGAGAARSGGDAWCPARGAHPRRPPRREAPHRPGRPFSRAGAPSGDTLAGPPLSGPRREPRVTAVTGALTCGKGPSYPALALGTRKWPG